MVEIDRWDCILRADGSRMAVERGGNFSCVVWSHEHGLNFNRKGDLPPLVLEWLLKERLRRCYCEGWSDRNGIVTGDVSPSPPRIYVD